MGKTLPGPIDYDAPDSDEETPLRSQTPIANNAPTCDLQNSSRVPGLYSAPENPVSIPNLRSHSSMIIPSLIWSFILAHLFHGLLHLLLPSAIGAQFPVMSSLNSLHSRFYGLLLLFVGSISTGLRLGVMDLKSFVMLLLIIYAAIMLSSLAFAALSWSVDAYNALNILCYGVWLVGMVMCQKINFVGFFGTVDIGHPWNGEEVLK
jgi:hypothetical protein